MLFATVRQRKIYVKNPTTVIRNGVNVDWLTLDMDEEWAQMDSIVCVFANGSVSVEQLYTYGTSVLVPWECLQETGFLTVSITGYVQDEKVMTTMNPDSGWNVVQNGTMTGSAPLEPTPSLYEQILAATGNATSAAKIANEAAEAATAATERLTQASDGIFAAAEQTAQNALSAAAAADRADESAENARIWSEDTAVLTTSAIDAANRAEEAAERAENAGGGGSVDVPKMISDLEDDTDVSPVKRAQADADGNAISTTYAKKTDVETALGDIDSALDGIIALQNSYIGGDA